MVIDYFKNKLMPKLTFQRCRVYSSNNLCKKKDRCLLCYSDELIVVSVAVLIGGAKFIYLV